jgi:hypothetical protein
MLFLPLIFTHGHLFFFCHPERSEGSRLTRKALYTKVAKGAKLFGQSSLVKISCVLVVKTIPRF